MGRVHEYAAIADRYVDIGSGYVRFGVPQHTVLQYELNSHIVETVGGERGTEVTVEIDGDTVSASFYPGISVRPLGDAAMSLPLVGRLATDASWQQIAWNWQSGVINSLDVRSTGSGWFDSSVKVQERIKAGLDQPLRILARRINGLLASAGGLSVPQLGQEVRGWFDELAQKETQHANVGAYMKSAGLSMGTSLTMKADIRYGGDTGTASITMGTRVSASLYTELESPAPGSKPRVCATSLIVDFKGPQGEGGLEIVTPEAFIYVNRLTISGGEVSVQPRHITALMASGAMGIAHGFAEVWSAFEQFANATGNKNNLAVTRELMSAKRRAAPILSRALTDSLEQLIEGGLDAYLRQLPPEVVVDPMLVPGATCRP
jgi:hypothetical protein